MTTPRVELEHGLKECGCIRCRKYPKCEETVFEVPVMCIRAKLQAAHDLGRDGERRFPIIKGASVPWSAMAPFERQAKENHGGQSLEKLASRGGLGRVEAWAVVNSICYYDVPKNAAELWDAWADKVNNLPPRTPHTESDP